MSLALPWLEKCDFCVSNKKVRIVKLKLYSEDRASSVSGRLVCGGKSEGWRTPRDLGELRIKMATMPPVDRAKESRRCSVTNRCRRLRLWKNHQSKNLLSKRQNK